MGRYGRREHCHPGLYRLVDPYYAIAEMYGQSGFTYVKGTHYVLIDATDPDGVFIGLQATGLDMQNDGDQMVVGSVAGNALAGGASLEELKAAGVCGTLKDGVITFPNETLFGSWISAIQQNYIWYANKAGEFYLEVGAPSAKKSKAQAFKTSVQLGKVEKIKPTSFISCAIMDAKAKKLSKEQALDIRMSMIKNF